MSTFVVLCLLYILVALPYLTGLSLWDVLVVVAIVAGVTLMLYAIVDCTVGRCPKRCSKHGWTTGRQCQPCWKEKLVQRENRKTNQTTVL